MKVLIATKQTQGQRKSDFCNADEYDLVMFAQECDGERIDGKCGCRRSFVGLKSHKATTTTVVVERDMTQDELVDAIRESLVDGGWAFGDDGDEFVDSWAREEAGELARIANVFKVGMIVEKRGTKIQQRRDTRADVEREAKRNGTS